MILAEPGKKAGKTSVDAQDVSADGAVFGLEFKCRALYGVGKDAI